ncbi:MAG: LemA family protein [Thermodesulfobacteriota bacterium]|nr:LemA family protein [Thermodesulfobacteriota bacterium]
MIIWIIPAVIVVGILIWMIGIYNRLVRNKNMVEEGWSGIEVQLKRRSNLIPNLIEAVKGYMGHETKLLSEITQLRSQSNNTQAVAEKSRVETSLTRSLGNLIAVAESYPDLKANQNFLDLQNELSQIENDIQMARRYFNGTVRNLNIMIEAFPSNLVAGQFGFAKADFFEIDEPGDREVPDVKF